MSSSLITSIHDELELLIAPLVSAVEDVGALNRLLAALGANETLANDGTLLAALQTAATLRVQVESVAAAPEPSFSGIAAILEASSALFTALRGLDATNESEFLRLGADIVAVLTGEYLRTSHSLLYRLGALLTLVDPLEQSSSTLGVSSGGKLVRVPFPCARLRFDRLQALVNSPGGTLRSFYLSNDLATLSDANITADTLFPRIGALLCELDVIWSYGVPADDLAVLGDAAPFVDHAFQIYVPPAITGSDVEAGITFTLSSADRGDLGVVLTPFGTLEFSTQVGAWQFNAKLQADVQALAIGRHGATILASAQTTTIDGSFAVALVPPTTGAPAFVFGSATGTRLELGTAKLGATMNLTADDASVGVSAGVSSGVLVIAAGDGDSFLQEILPTGGLRATFDLGMAYSTNDGLSFHGGAGLSATLPVSLSLAGTVSLQAIHLGLTVDDSGVVTEVSAIASLNIGPISAVVDRMGISATATFPAEGGNLGLIDLGVGFKAPSGVGLAINAAGLVGGGFLDHDDSKQEYAGLLQLAFESFELTAFGLLSTSLPSGPGYSLIAMVDAEFPPVELGLGFTLDGVGGLFGVHRMANVDALRAGLTAHTLSTLLFPKNPIANAPQLLSELDALFPGAAGRFIFGPIVRIEWGTPALLTLDLALVLELPDPVRLILIAELAVLLPNPTEKLVEIHVSALGTIDFGTSEGSLDAVLHDSRLMRYTLHGSMALRVNWSGQKTFVLAVGGVHPKFQPPPNFPKLDRIGISMPTGHIVKLNLDGYLAVTSNSLQIGAHVDLAVGVDGFGISGCLSFDTLIQRHPFHFDGDISGGVALSVDSHDLMALRMSGSLTGPAPWNAAGSVSFEVLGWSVTKSFSETFGDSADTPPLSQIDVGQLLRAALADPNNFAPLIGSDAPSLASLATPGGSMPFVLAYPGASLTVHQTVVPLGLDITQYGGAAPLGETRFDITGVSADGAAKPFAPVLDDFAPGQFLALSDDDELASPSFERLAAGAQLDGGTIFGAATTRTVAYETFLVDTVDGPLRELGGLPTPFPLSVLGGVLFDGAAGRSVLAGTGSRHYAGAHQSVMPAELTFIVATSEQLSASGVGGSTGLTYSQARAALDSQLVLQPEQVGTLLVGATYEVAM